MSVYVTVTVELNSLLAAAGALRDHSRALVDRAAGTSDAALARLLVSRSCIAETQASLIEVAARGGQLNTSPNVR